MIKSYFFIEIYKLHLISFFILLAGVSFGQDQGEDVIILKNGTKKRGIIVVQKPGAYIQLLAIPSKDTIQIDYAEIEQINKIIEASPIIDSVAVKDVVEDAPFIPFNMRKYYVSFNYSLGGGDWSSSAYGINIVRTFTDRIQAGIGFVARGGLNNSNVPIYQSFPITVDLRYKLQEKWNGRTALMFNTSFGYNVLKGGYYYAGKYVKISDGAYFQTGIGYRINFSKNIGCIIDLSYQRMNTKSYYKKTEEFVQKHIYSSGLIGLTFFF